MLLRDCLLGQQKARNDGESLAKKNRNVELREKGQIQMTQTQGKQHFVQTRLTHFVVCTSNGAVAVRKKVVSIGHFLPCFCLQSLKFIRSNQKQLYVLIALKIIEK